jgi:hypothetical protein
MKFDKQIDNSIVTALTEKPTIYYMELLEVVRRSYRHISLDTFNSHIRKMLSEGYIGKNDTGERGKKVYYFLTEKTKQMERLKILNFNAKNDITELNDQSEQEKRLHALLIFFLSDHIAYQFKTEEQLKDFLSEAGVSMNDLGLPGEPITLYSDGKPCKVTVQKTRSGINVSKWEELTPNKNIFYSCSLPGSSPSEVLSDSEDRVFTHANITQKEMEDAFCIAQREGLLKRVMKFRNEGRYKIADQSLVNFIGDCLDLFKVILEKLQIVWRTIRTPNNQEIKWLELFKGRREADAIRNQAYQHRHSLKRSEKKKRIALAKKEIEDREKEIQESITDLVKWRAATVDKYWFPCERILEIAAPKSLQKSDLRTFRRRISPK